MRLLLRALLVVLAAAGTTGILWFLEYAPWDLDLLPAWMTAFLPAPAGAAAGWFAFGLVAVIVLAALGIGLLARGEDERQVPASTGGEP